MIGHFAVIYAASTLGEGVHVHDYSMICPGAVLSEMVEVGSHSVVDNDAVVGQEAHVGSHCVVGRGAVVGEGAVLGDGASRGVPWGLAPSSARGRGCWTARGSRRASRGGRPGSATGR